jgi:hypothetical protein
MVALSTTLAPTPAWRAKAGAPKLLFIGVDRKTVELWSARRAGLTEPDKIYLPEARADDGRPRRMNRPTGTRSSGIASLVSGRRRAGHRRGNAASNALSWRRRRLPPFPGGNDLRSSAATICSATERIRRGASALLNGRLIPVLHEFL